MQCLLIISDVLIRNRPPQLPFIQDHQIVRDIDSQGKVLNIPNYEIFIGIPIDFESDDFRMTLKCERDCETYLTLAENDGKIYVSEEIPKGNYTIEIHLVDINIDPMEVEYSFILGVTD